MSMTLFSGRRADPWNLTPEDLEITTIAHSLSLLCRFGGHSKQFYSVAQHCVRVSQALPPEQRLQGLLHDATETFIQDLIRPVKRRLQQYKDLELRIWQQFAFKWSLPERLSDDVVLADDACLKSEIRQLLNAPGRDIELALPYWDNVKELPPAESIWSPREAEGLFLMNYGMALVEFIRYKGNVALIPVSH